MKVKRSWLLAAPIAMAVILISYTLARQFLGFSLGEAFEKNMFNGILIVAVGVMVLNRKLISDEKKELERREREEQETRDREASGEMEEEERQASAGTEN